MRLGPQALALTLALAAGCGQKSTQELAADARESAGEVAKEQEDVRDAEAAMEKARARFQKEAKELERAKQRAAEAQTDLSQRLHADSAALRTAPAAAAPSNPAPAPAPAPAP